MCAYHTGKIAPYTPTGYAPGIAFDLAFAHLTDKQ
jgi:hypothetical protein